MLYACASWRSSARRSAENSANHSDDRRRIGGPQIRLTPGVSHETCRALGSSSPSRVGAGPFSACPVRVRQVLLMTWLRIQAGRHTGRRGRHLSTRPQCKRLLLDHIPLATASNLPLVFTKWEAVPLRSSGWTYARDRFFRGETPCKRSRVHSNPSSTR